MSVIRDGSLVGWAVILQEILSSLLFKTGMKYLSVLMELILWCWLFIIPAGIAGFLAYHQYYHHPKNITTPIVLFASGVALGIFLAEIIRRKIGLNYFFSSIKASPDFDKMSQSEEEDKKII